MLDCRKTSKRNARYYSRDYSFNHLFRPGKGLPIMLVLCSNVVFTYKAVMNTSTILVETLARIISRTSSCIWISTPLIIIPEHLVLADYVTVHCGKHFWTLWCHILNVFEIIRLDYYISQTSFFVMTGFNRIAKNLKVGGRMSWLIWWI